MYYIYIYTYMALKVPYVPLSDKCSTFFTGWSPTVPVCCLLVGDRWWMVGLSQLVI